MQSGMKLMEERLDVCGVQHRLGGHAPNSRTRSTMVVSWGGNACDSKVVDGKVLSNVLILKIGDIRNGKHVASKDGDVGDNGGLIGTCKEIDEGDVKVLGENRVDYVDCGNIVSYVDRPPPLPRPWIGCIINAVNDIRGMMGGLYDVDVSSLCAPM